MNSLVEAAGSIGFAIDESQVNQFRRYLELLGEWNRNTNLTAVKDPDDVVEQLFIRSLRVAVPAGGNVSTAGWFEGRRIIDVGTGAGFPGLPLKLALPGSELTLLESNRKKCAFLEHVVSDLRLEGVTIVNARAEDAAHDSDHRERYELATARGVASLAVLAEYVLPFLQMGGVAVLPKGPDLAHAKAEADDASYAADELGAAPAIIQAVAHPGRSATDHIVYWLKVQPTPERYPRRAGVPSKRPLVAARVNA